MERLLRLQFLEIMEGSYKEQACGPFYFKNGHVQAAFVRFDNPPEDAPSRMQMMKFLSQKDICHIIPYREFIALLFENISEAAVKRHLEDIYSNLKKTNVWFALALGSRCQELNAHAGQGIRKTCREAEKLMEHSFFCREKKYITFEDIPVNSPAQGSTAPLVFSEEVKQLCAYIQIIDHAKIRSFFRELESLFIHSGKSPREIRQECMVLMIEVRCDLVKKIPAVQEKLENGNEVLNAIMEMPCLGAVIDAMTEAALHISECLPLLSADSCFRRIISYVRNNYHEDLSLETLGRLFHYNCAYLGKRFKEYAGKSFHTYLDTLRIDAAQELLQHSGMRVYEISTAVGYANTDYFYSKFKKYTGKSPSFFREKAEKVQFL